MNKKQRKWWAELKVRISCELGIHNRWTKKLYEAVRTPSYSDNSISLFLSNDKLDEVMKFTCRDCGAVKFKEVY